MKYCFVELSKSNRSICRICKKRINKNLPRLVYITYGEDFACYDCYKTFIEGKKSELKDRIKQLKRSEKDMKKIIKKNSKAIMIEKLR